MQHDNKMYRGEGKSSPRWWEDKEDLIAHVRESVEMEEHKMTKLLSVCYTKAIRACDSCKHEIHNLYHIQLDSGDSITVGSECARNLLRYDVMQALSRYRSQAAREWKANSPKPLEHEDRGDYIARRTNEKLQARKAWQVWQSTDKEHHWYTNPWRDGEREACISTIEQKYGVLRSDWLQKTAYSI